MDWNSIKLITFDLDNTLWPVEEVIVEAEHKLHAHMQKRYPHLESKIKNQELRGMRTRLLQTRPEYVHDLSSLRRDSIREFLVEGGLSTSEATLASGAAFDVFIEARNQVHFFEGAERTLRNLRKHVTLGALTNGNADVERVGLGDVFSFHYSSEKVGKRKPAPEMFVAALEHAGVRPEQALHVGDHPLEDIAAALDVGMSAIWANPLGAVWPQDLAPPDWSFSTFDELEQWFDS